MPRRHKKIILLHLSFIILLFNLMPATSEARQPFRAVLQSVTLDGRLILGDSQTTEPGTIIVNLDGIHIPPKAIKPFQKYIRKTLGGRQLVVKITKVLQESPTFRIYKGIILLPAGTKQINLNKQLLVDGYAVLQRDNRLAKNWVPYEDKGRQRKIGLWSLGTPRWIIPHLPRALPQATAQGTDRDRIIAMYGMPDFTRKLHEKDLEGVISYHIMIQDFYIKEGLVFIYRDGRLLNKQPYTER